MWLFLKNVFKKKKNSSSKLKPSRKCIFQNTKNNPTRLFKMILGEKDSCLTQTRASRSQSDFTKEQIIHRKLCIHRVAFSYCKDVSSQEQSIRGRPLDFISSSRPVTANRIGKSCRVERWGRDKLGRQTSDLRLAFISVRLRCRSLTHSLSHMPPRSDVTKYCRSLVR